MSHADLPNFAGTAKFCILQENAGWTSVSPDIGVGLVGAHEREGALGKTGHWEYRGTQHLVQVDEGQLRHHVRESQRYLASGSWSGAAPTPLEVWAGPCTAGVLGRPAGGVHGRGAQDPLQAVGRGHMNSPQSDGARHSTAGQMPRLPRSAGRTYCEICPRWESAR